MEKIQIATEQRPNYSHGQLLLAEDFLAEQDYHVQARLQHNLKLHDWGVVHGLTVSREQDTSLTINPGVAIDASGYEIHLGQTQRISVAGFGPKETLQVGLAYEKVPTTSEVGSAPPKTRNFSAMITVSSLDKDAIGGLTLARVQLDDHGHLDEKTIDYSFTKYARIVAPKRGWWRSTFRPVPMVEGPEEGFEEGLPAFRVGATEARSPTPQVAGQPGGAAGTMAIPIPPNVTSVTRLRIAGSENQGEIRLELIVGGWDREQRKHIRKPILDEIIPTASPFFKEYAITSTALDPEYNTLALWLKGTQKTAVSLIAIEFAY